MGSMRRSLAELTVEEFKELLERTLDRRLEMWLTKFMHAVEVLSDEGADEHTSNPRCREYNHVAEEHDDVDDDYRDDEDNTSPHWCGD
jgi:hypothetical protein